MGHGNLARRSKILEFEDALRKVPQLKQRLTHHFADGIYARELFIPKGAALVGMIHKFETFNFMPVGKMAVATEDGSKIIEAPYWGVSPAGIKRAGVALEDSIWICVHASKNRDLGKLEKELVTNDYSDVGKISFMKKLLRFWS